MYRYLQVYNRLYNYVHADFIARFQAIACVVAVVMLYGSIKAFKLLSLVIYLLFPLTAVEAFVCLISLNGYIYLVERKSVQVLTRMKIVASRTAPKYMTELRILRKELRAMKSLRSKAGNFGHTCLELPQAEMAQVFNYILLLLEY